MADQVADRSNETGLDPPALRLRGAIPWDSPTFGAAGANVHKSSTGSWLMDAHGDEPVQS